MPKTKLPALISTFSLCYLFWVLLTWSFEAQELIAGAVVSLAAALFAYGFLIHDKSRAFWLFNPVKLGLLVGYTFVFFGELIKANLDMARRVFGGCREINPGIVKVPVDLNGDYCRAMLANSITLTPGTITMDIAEQDGQTYFYIHWIDVSETDRVKAGKTIKGRMEPWVRRIWQ